jgi:hypothetical protein
LPEDINRNPAARIPVTANPQPDWPHLSEQPLANANRTILVKGGVVAKATQEEFQ